MNRHPNTTKASAPPMRDHPDDLVTWNPQRMATGVDSVDEQHQEMIRLINQLHRACVAGTGKEKVGWALSFLSAYVQTHFVHEENLMEIHHCPAHARNKEAHERFLKDFTKMADEFKAKGESTSLLLALRRLVGNWLVNHICLVDIKLRECGSVGACRRRA